jgi:pyridoxamine 5'-phosphate oxidase
MSLRTTLRAILTLGRGVVSGLPDHAAGDDPIALFELWFADARGAGLFLPESMTVATATPDGRPSARMMLLKGIDRGTFVFYTNHESRKAAEVADNARAALVLHWPVLQRQVRIEGTVTRMSDEDSQAYFRTRPRGSQIGAWASRQSAELADREELEQRVREIEERYSGLEIPLPPFWGGYRVWPEQIEFWQGRANRLHDRLVYTRDGDRWRRFRVYP